MPSLSDLPDVPLETATDQRMRRSRKKVLEVAVQLMVERGFGGATVDEIARRSGVAKTTIYRHWPTRADLLRDAGSQLDTPLATPDEGTFEGDMTALSRSLAEALQTARWPAVLPSVIDAAERDPAIAEMYAGLQRGFNAPYAAVIERARRRGELPEGADASAMVAVLIGALFFRRWFSREALDDDFVRSVVRLVT